MKFLPVVSNGQNVYAGFWYRFAAGLIDAVIMTPLAFLFVWLNGLSHALAIALSIPSAILFAMYNVFFNARFGGTLGKLAAEIRVTKPDGTRIDWPEAWKRSAVDLVFAFFLLIAELWGLMLISPELYVSLEWTERELMLSELAPAWCEIINDLAKIWIWSELVVLLFNKRKRAIHDFIAGTVVIKKEFRTD